MKPVHSPVEAADVHPLDAVLTTNEAFMLIVVVLLGSMSYILDKVYKKSKKLFWLAIVFPPTLLWCSYKYRSELKQGLIYIATFLFFTLLLAILTRIEYFGNLVHIVKMISLWPYYLFNFAKDYLLPALR